jgi:class 3 adenylate cyclase
MNPLPTTRYADSDGVQIAYQVVGVGDIDVLFLPMWYSHVELIWDAPRRRAFLERLASFGRLIIFDQRGTGLSDSVAISDILTLEERAKDALAVLDTVGSEQAVFLAVGYTAPLGCYLAATRVDRARALVLLNGTARLEPAPDYPVTRGMRIARDADQVRATWGTPEWAAPGFMNTAEVAETARYQRHGIGPGSAATLFASLRDLDVREVLPAIHVPTLVAHRVANRFVPIDHGQYLSNNIDGARFLELPGSDPAWAYADPTDFLDEVQEFLTGVRPVPDPDRVLATVLFTDVVASTETASRLGDSRWRGQLERHAAVVGREVDRFNGRLVRVAGEESLATFDGPARAIRCALAIGDSLRALGLGVRAGLHTGEIELIGEDIGGIGVHIGARIAAMACDGEVLVSSTVKDLVAGSGIVFEGRGSHEFKGVPEEWRVFAVTDDGRR